jgi:hypothetical protein
MNRSKPLQQKAIELIDEVVEASEYSLRSELVAYSLQYFPQMMFNDALLKLPSFYMDSSSGYGSQGFHLWQAIKSFVPQESAGTASERESLLQLFTDKELERRNQAAHTEEDVRSWFIYNQNNLTHYLAGLIGTPETNWPLLVNNLLFHLRGGSFETPRDV